MMIPLVGKVGDDLRKKYGNTQNLPQNGTKKPSLSECYSCECFEAGPDLPRVGVVNWCILKVFDRIKKRTVTHYANIELLECCPKMAKKR